ncbi:ATP-binding cassette domain-containing protein [Sanguibacter antarcticus]|uniref:ABC-type dipeptide/oligopeptide/nickel transport system ATPase subunit n=1 Tax=Sanguibacter antarcticus TaxID=372484 RepID=A0A2A9E5I8_9MICO|nr:ATP-binding cassette domain-containing protein [Sanguibacter antarcticus]PFG34317.1 ABC-type dipeptide/oligopeptide/nickel transport system ATPase subunit [Sanguibacter antarcticus]
MSATTNVLSATGLVAGHASTPSVRGIDLTITPGEGSVGVIGGSGVGKSTLLQAITGDLKLRGGRVTFDGRTVGRMGPRDKKRFGVAVRAVRQNGFGGLDPRQTVERAVEGELSRARKAGRATGGTATDVLALMFLEPRFLGRGIRSLSGGERQRLALAAALSTRPDILVLDEPATALDQSLKDAVVRRLVELTTERGTGLLVASHDLELVSRVCQTVHVLADGVFVESGTPHELLTNPVHPVTREIAEALPAAVGAFR